MVIQRLALGCSIGTLLLTLLSAWAFAQAQVSEILGEKRSTVVLLVTFSDRLTIELGGTFVELS